MEVFEVGCPPRFQRDLAAQENDAETETCYVLLCVCVVFHVLPDQGRLADVYIYLLLAEAMDFC